MDRRDRFEELFRERLHNWECEPDSEQWKTLAGFLPLRPTRFSTRSIRRTAAIVTLLLLMGGGLLYDRLIPETTTEIVRNRIQPFIVDHIQIPQLTGTVTTDQIADSLLPVLTRKPIYTTGKTISTDKYKSQETKILPIVIASKALETDFSPVLIVRNTKTEPVKVRKASRKWHLGMGNGNVNWNETVKPGAKEIGFDYSCLIAATNDRVPTVYVENGDVVGRDPSDPIEVSYEQNFEGEPTAISNPEMLKMQWAHGHNNSIVNGIPRIGYMKGGKKARWKDEDMADYFVDKVKNFITEHRDSSFFLYYGLHEPHVPRAPHQRFVGKTTMGPRGDAIVEADWCVGELLTYLKKEGLLEKTLIIFSSDNGPVLNDGYKDGAPELAGKHAPAGGLRGGKYSLFDGGTHIPLFVYWKGKIQPVKSDALVCQMDLLASLGSMVGATLPDGLDSRNYLNAFMGTELKARENLIIEAQGRLGYRSGDWIMMPPYKGSQRNLTGNELGNLDEFSLFDVKSDKGQKSNVAGRHPELLERLKQEFFVQTDGFYRSEVEEEPLK